MEYLHQVAERMYELLSAHAPAMGDIRIRLDTGRQLHVETREIKLQLGQAPTPPAVARPQQIAPISSKGRP